MSDKHTPDVIWAWPSPGRSGGYYADFVRPTWGHETYLLATPAREAAGDMLEALKAALAHMDAVQLASDWTLAEDLEAFRASSIVRAAIASATGEEDG